MQEKMKSSLHLVLKVSLFSLAFSLYHLSHGCDFGSLLPLEYELERQEVEEHFEREVDRKRKRHSSNILRKMCNNE